MADAETLDDLPSKLAAVIRKALDSGQWLITVSYKHKERPPNDLKHHLHPHCYADADMGPTVHQLGKMAGVKKQGGERWR